MRPEALREKLGRRDRRKLENNTYIRNEDGTIYVRLHATDIITLTPDDTWTLTSGGWKTVTTKDRLNKYGPVHIYQDRGTWYVREYITKPFSGWTGPDCIFQDGMRVHPDGKISGALSLQVDKVLQRGRATVRTYAKKFILALKSGKVPVPSSGDCWYCSMITEDGQSLGEKTKDQDHLKNHIKESYFVPSLLMRATETFPVSQACKQSIYGYMTGQREYIWESDWLMEQATKSLTRYLYRHLNLGA